MCSCETGAMTTLGESTTPSLGDFRVGGGPRLKVPVF